MKRILVHPSIGIIVPLSLARAYTVRTVSKVRIQQRRSINTYLIGEWKDGLVQLSLPVFRFTYNRDPRMLFRFSTRSKLVRHSILQFQIKVDLSPMWKQ